MLSKFPCRGVARLLREQEDVGSIPATPKLSVLLDHVAELKVEPNQALFRAGDPADGLYVMVSGSIRVPGRHGFRRVASFAPGVVVGEMGLLDGGPRSAEST